MLKTSCDVNGKLKCPNISVPKRKRAVYCTIVSNNSPWHLASVPFTLEAFRMNFCSVERPYIMTPSSFGWIFDILKNSPTVFSGFFFEVRPRVCFLTQYTEKQKDAFCLCGGLWINDTQNWLTFAYLSS